MDLSSIISDPRDQLKPLGDLAPFPSAHLPLSSTLEEFKERFTYQNETFKFEPFQPENTRPASTSNIPNNINHESPIEWFHLFYTPEILRVITNHTNEYATWQRRIDKGQQQRPWQPLCVEELQVFLGVVIYMGVHHSPQIEDYWNTDLKKGPLHSVAAHMSLVRFEQIKRYLHVSSIEADQREGKEANADTIWWHKVEPLASHLNGLFKHYYTPSSHVSIDELMIRCFGRSLHTYKMPNKPITQGYKLYGLADDGYLFCFHWSSRVHGLEKVTEVITELTKTGMLVTHLISKLPRKYITIYMDNFFTSVPLFQLLRERGFGACGTTRPHSQFPSVLREIKDKWGKKLPWNSLYSWVVNGTLCIAWQDNNIVLFLTTIHSPSGLYSMVERIRKAPSKTSTNAAHARKPFDGSAIKSLLIPRFIDDYNHFMGGVDLANQLRASYEVHRPTRRTWWPIFFWLLDASIVNAYKLSVIHAQHKALKAWDQAQFRMDLASSLIGFSTAVQIVRLNETIIGPRLFETNAHHWETRLKRSECAACLYKQRRARIESRGVKKYRRAPIARKGCSFCKVPLCRNGDCWNWFHTASLIVV